MEALRIVPRIYYFDTVQEFCEQFSLGSEDIIVTNSWIYEPYMKGLCPDVPVIFQEEYGNGEPTDQMIDRMAAAMKKYRYDRIIAFGGGTVIDLCKVLALELPKESAMLFMQDTPLQKKKELIAVPTTCGTGSEVTNVAIAEMTALHVKKGLTAEATYADIAVLITEPLMCLPNEVFAASSIDALIHALESYLSPKATPFTEMYSQAAAKFILEGYRKIAERGGNTGENRKDLLKDFCLAADYAGIAFGNAGCAAVHALSYSIGGAFHIPHGEANYQFFTAIFQMYQKKRPNGKIAEVNKFLAEILGCDTGRVYDELAGLLNLLMVRRPLREYGMTEAQIEEFTKSTVQNQQRLLANNYVSLTEEEIKEIFRILY